MYGGARGILSEHSIQSALARPYHGYHRSIHQKAAALLHGVATNHSFSDGNKRTSLYLVELLIQRSGYELVEENHVLVETITGVAKGEIGYDELCEWFRTRLLSMATENCALLATGSCTVGRLEGLFQAIGFTNGQGAARGAQMGDEDAAEALTGKWNLEERGTFCKSAPFLGRS